jgi:AraC-like DNA-binding protein
MTSITGKMPTLPFGTAGARAQTLGAAGLPHARFPGGRLSPAALGYEKFRTNESEAARRFFAGAYKPSWLINGLERRSAVTHQRCETASMTLDEVLIQGRAECEITAADSVMVIQPRAGSLTVAGDRLPAPDCPVLVADGMPCVLQLNAARFHVVIIAADVLHRVAAERHELLPQRFQFLDRRPRSGAAVRAWHRALDYVTATFASPDTLQQPLIAAAAGPLLATALLECYPSNLTAEHDLLSDPAVPDALKDAVAFIHRHAADDVGVNDIAAAVHLTSRAVQYLFRQQLDTTPTEYLRRVRLHRAHHDLLAGDRSAMSVTEVAQRWGFLHTGRFAALYRQTYGHSPHTTLSQ